MRVLQGKGGRILDNFFRGFWAIMNAKDDVTSAGGHGVEPEAIPVRVIDNNALIGKTIFPQGHLISQLLEIQDAAIIF